MITIFIVSIVFFAITGILLGMGKHEEVVQNWTKYRANPFYMMTAFLYKPDDDPQSRFQFMQDNFNKVLQSLVADVFKAALAPIFDIFQLTAGGISGSNKGLGHMQNIIKTMMTAFNSIFNIFERRFQSTLFRTTMTFRGIQTAMERVWAVTVNSLYQSMATISAILSTLDLIIKIVIIILVILVSVVLFLFLFLWPVIPVILSVIGVLVTAGMGAAVGGMAGTFCFAGGTGVQMEDGTVKPIHEIAVGDAVKGGKVTARMEFLQSGQDLFNLHGIHVTGDHIVWYQRAPIHVRDHPHAKHTPQKADIPLYCLNVSSHKIHVQSDVGDVVFADWEEIEGEEDQEVWNRHVYSSLNPGGQWNVEKAVLEGEAAFHPATLVIGTQQQLIEIAKIRPGMTVFDENERPTRVLGIVEVASSEIACSVSPMSAAVWFRASPYNSWEQKGGSGSPATRKNWYSLITEHGTFRLVNGVAVRDYTDVGTHKIAETYKWVLQAMGKTGV